MKYWLPLILCFKTSGQDVLGSALGMKVDAKRRILMVVSDSLPGSSSGIAKNSPAGLFQYDLKTGMLRFKYQLAPGAAGFLNDVALTSTGEAFATDTGTGEVFLASPEHDGLRLFLPANSILRANGISVSSDDKLLLVAGWIGVTRVEIATRQFTLLAKPRNVSDAGLDGMYSIKDRLAAFKIRTSIPGACCAIS